MKWFLLLLMSSSLVMAEDKVCHKCQVIREYNAAHPENNYEYYDDYLKEKGQNQNTKNDAKKNEKLACGKCGCKDTVNALACDKCKGKTKDNAVLACDKCKGKSKDNSVLACDKCKGKSKDNVLACDKCKGKTKDNALLACGKCKGKSKNKRLLACDKCKGKSKDNAIV